MDYFPSLLLLLLPQAIIILLSIDIQAKLILYIKTNRVPIKRQLVIIVTNIYSHTYKESFNLGVHSEFRTCDYEPWKSSTDTGYGRSKMELHGTVTFQLPVGCGGSSLPSQWRNSPKPICGICLSPRLWASLSRSWINMTEVDARASSPLTGERNLDSISSAGARIFSLRIAFFTPAPPTLFRIHDFRFSTRLWISNLRKLELRLKARGRTLIQLNKKKKKEKEEKKKKEKKKWLVVTYEGSIAS